MLSQSSARSFFYGVKRLRGVFNRQIWAVILAELIVQELLSGLLHSPASLAS